MRIQDHYLAWRWTDPNYAVLPNEVLAQMHPVTPAEAATLDMRSRPFLGKDGLSHELQSNLISTDKLDQEDGCAWLRKQQPSLEELVILSWDAGVALRTTWGVFTSYWSEFCYPASDDLVVFPELEAWVLLYHHEQEFQFGTRAVSAEPIAAGRRP